MIPLPDYQLEDPAGEAIECRYCNGPDYTVCRCAEDVADEITFDEMMGN